MIKIAQQRSLIILFALPFIFSACGGQDEPVYSTISEATLTTGEVIPVPSEEIILTVTGNVGTSNEADHIIMDIPTIEAAGLVEYTVMDPFKEEEVTYTGPLMSDLLDLWQIAEDAETLEMTALNDYRVNVPIELIRDYPIIFALQADGAYMPVSDKGPAMLVLPYDDYDFERPSSDAYWIWQIKSIHVN